MTWARWRIPFMVLVYALFFLHAATYHYWGIKTVGHLGFGEFFGALSSGLITAGTIFTVVVFIHALFYGGWFCGWLCHWGILQDLAMGIYRKIGIKPKMVRVHSLWVPWAWFLVIIGQVSFSWYHLGFPDSLKFSYGATPVWSGVPLSIFLICITTIASGFLLILLFGERAFCRTICTFRLWFRWFAILAPHNVRLKQGCISCTKQCGNACPMGIDVAGEVDAFGAVRNTGCMKCYTCVLACPGKVLEPSFKQSFAVTPKTDYLAPPVDLAPRNIFFQSLFSLLLVLLFCIEIGGNVCMSLGFILGFLTLRVMADKNVALFEVVVVPFMVFALIFKADLNNPTSLAKGLAVIAAFLVMAKVVGYSRGEDFIQNKGNSYTPHWGLITMMAVGVFSFGAYQTVLSFQKYEHRATEKSGDFLRLSCLLEAQVSYMPDKPAGYKMLGVASMKAGDLPKAQENLQKSWAETSDPNTARLLYSALLGQNKTSEALALLNMTLASYPYYPPFLQEKASILMQMQDLKGAEEMLTRILSKDSENLQAHQTLGLLLVSQKRMEEAENEFLQAYQKSPGVSAKYLARFYSKVGALSEAENFFQEAISVASGDPTLFFDRGVNFAKQNKVSNAIQSWQKVLEIDPNCIEASRNIENGKALLASASPGLLY